MKDYSGFGRTVQDYSRLRLIILDYSGFSTKCEFMVIGFQTGYTIIHGDKPPA